MLHREVRSLVVRLNTSHRSRQDTHGLGLVQPVDEYHEIQSSRSPCGGYPQRMDSFLAEGGNAEPLCRCMSTVYVRRKVGCGELYHRRSNEATNGLITKVEHARMELDVNCDNGSRAKGAMPLVGTMLPEAKPALQFKYAHAAGEIEHPTHARDMVPPVAVERSVARIWIARVLVFDRSCEQS